MRTAFVFPGLGAFFADPFAHFPAGQQIATELASQIDAVAVSYGCPSVLSGSDSAVWSALSEVQIYHVELSCYRILLEEFRLRPDVLFGHSLGEITALVVAGGLTVEDGATLLCERAEALRTHASADSATAAFMMSPTRAEEFAAQVEDVAVAAVNSPAQVILSGSSAGLAFLADLARAEGVTVTALRAGPYPQHHPGLAAAFEHYSEAVRGIQPSPLTIAVWSPVLGRELEAGDDLVRLAALQMVRPLDFRDAATQLSLRGVSQFVECGLKDTLVRLVSETLGERALVWAPFRKRLTETDGRQTIPPSLITGSAL